MSCCNKTEEGIVDISKIFKPKMAQTTGCGSGSLPRIASFLLGQLRIFAIWIVRIVIIKLIKRRFHGIAI